MTWSSWLKTLALYWLLLMNRIGVGTSNVTSTDSPMKLFPTITPPVNASAKTLRKSRQDEIDILPPHYYREVAPVEDGKPVIVEVSVVILSMKLCSDSSQTFDADLFYHNFWTDNRLQKPTNADAIAQRIKLSSDESLPQYRLSDSWRKRLWIPDTYFRNAISGSISNILSPTYYFTVTNYVKVFMAVRLQMRLSCEMNFQKYPFDTQKCFLNITTTSEDSDTVKLVWNSFRMGSHIDITEFTILSVDYKECTKLMDIGIFSCLYGEIVVKRNIGNYLIKRFIPSFIIVTMTFIGFWIPTAISPARTTIPITALLALVTQQIQSDLNVSYVYALQVWNIVSIIFVFANLLEFAIALYMMHQVQKYKTHRDANNGRFPEMYRTNIENGFSIEDRKPVVRTVWSLKWRKIKRRLREHFRSSSRNSSVDIISRYLFPSLYFCFVTLFTVYCIYH